MYNYEAAVISCLLKDYSCLEEIIFLNENDFIDHLYRDIFNSIKQLNSENTPSDIMTVGAKLESQYNGSIYGQLYDLHEMHCVVENVVLYAHEIQKNIIKKNLLNACQLIAKDINESDILDKAVNLINSIIAKENFEIKNADHVLDGFMEIIDKRVESKSALLGISSGFSEIDKITYGFQPGQLIILAARPGMGKSTLAVNFSTYEVYNNNGSVAFFTLEMSDISLMERIISAQANVLADDLKTGNLKTEDFQSIANQIQNMRGKNLFLLGCNKIEEIILLCKQLKRKHNLSCIVIDYLGLLLHGKHEHAHLILGEITRNLKKLAQKLQVPILLVCQMNRSIEQRTDKRPLLSDLKQSGAIEQDADVVMFLSRDDEIKDHALLSIAKNRNGMIGDVILKFDGAFNRFSTSDFSSAEYLKIAEKSSHHTKNRTFNYP